MCKNRNLKAAIAWAAVILWMALIFALSHQPREQSDQLSKGITQEIINVMEGAVPQATLDMQQMHRVVRKNAHFFAYLVLGMLVVNAFRVSGMAGTKVYVWALFLCIIYAAGDEVHQLFVPGRDGQLLDVALDTAGGAVGLLLFRCLKKG